MTEVNCHDYDCVENNNGVCAKDSIIINTFDTTSCIDYTCKGEVKEENE